MTVVAAFKFDDLVAAGKATCQADRAHGGLGTGVHHTHHVHSRDQFGDQFRHFHFHLGWRAEAQAALGGFNHRIADSRMVVTQHHRTPGADIIDIGFAIDIIQIRAVSTFDKQRRTAYAGKGANRRIHATWDKLAGCTVEVFRLAHGVVPGSYKMIKHTILSDPRKVMKFLPPFMPKQLLSIFHGMILRTLVKSLRLFV